jgi:hypothetical protein
MEMASSGALVNCLPEQVDGLNEQAGKDHVHHFF